jgi:Kdo2-lipid IVA lauroyltransferase/acyltransferase
MSHARHKLEEQALLGLGAAFRRLPRSLGLALGESLGDLVYLLGIRSQVTRENLRSAFPEWSAKEVRRTAHRCYRHFGALLAEFSRLPLLRSENVSSLVDFEGWEILDQALQAGKGGIVVTGHLGNWELMGAAVAVRGYPVSYVVTGQENELVEGLMDRLRESAGVRIIKRHQALKGVMKDLQANRLVAIISDQDAHEAGAFVPFFGRLASTPRGAALFALRSGAALIFADSYRQGRGKLKVVLERISQDQLSDDREAAINELVRRYTARLELSVRRRPEQWFWMHRRWKTPPPG